MAGALPASPRGRPGGRAPVRPAAGCADRPAAVRPTVGSGCRAVRRAAAVRGTPGRGAALDLGVDGVDVVAASGEAFQDEVVVGLARQAGTDHLVEGRQVHRHLRDARAAVGQARAERAASAAVAVVAEAEGLLGLDHPAVGAPTGGGGTTHRLAEDVRQAIAAAADLLAELLHAPDAGVGLPGMVVPGVQADLVAGGLGPPHQRAEFAADRLARPGGAGQQDVPAIQAGGARAEHLPEERRARQAPEVAAHVVRADAEEEGRLQPGFVEQLEQPRHPVAGAAEGVDVDAQAGLDHACASRSRSASWRKKSRVLPMVSRSSMVGCQSSRRRALSMLGLRWATSW